MELDLDFMGMVDVWFHTIYVSFIMLHGENNIFFCMFASKLGIQADNSGK